MSLLETNSYENFFAGADPINTESVTVASGNNVSQYQVLAKLASGKYAIYDSGTTGQDVADAIALEAVDASAADAIGIIVLTGAVNEDKLVLNSGDDADTVRDDLRQRGIILKKTQSAS